ncbi:hypothetical protein IMSAG049_01407 [Clostridiales bacterium]|nr:hypothetical protein IMSAG049_01407 [Clostridiales bacterium]
MKRKTFTLFFIVLIAGSSLIGCSKTNNNSINEQAKNEMQTETGQKVNENYNEQTESKTESSQEKDESKKTELMTLEELETKLAEQPVIVTYTDYVIQSDEYKALYPDGLQAILKNNSEDDIKDAVVAFVAWDENNLPVKIKGQFSWESSYIVEVNYEAINMISGGTFGEDSAFFINEECSGIEKVKAIVASYETFEGEKWENPYYQEFCSLYEGKKLG